MPHEATIFIEIIRLYALTMDKQKISKEKLKKAFIIFSSILEELIGDTIYFNYDQELDSFLSKHNDLFREDGNYITWDDDIEEIYANYIKCNHMNTLDFKVAELVLNVDIYDALRIKIDRELIAPYFNKNRALMQAFTKAAYNEFIGMPQDFKELKQIRNEFFDLFDELDNSTLFKIRVAHHIFDFKYGAHLSDHDFFLWRIILFSNSDKEWQLLTYNTIATLCEEFDEILDYEDEECQNYYIASESDTPILSTYEIFLKIFIIYLDKFLSCVNDFPGKESVITKKYLLLSLPELGDTLEHLLNGGYFQSLSINDSKYEITEEDLTNIYFEAIDCLTLLCKSDKELNNNPEFYSTMILAAIFIKSFFKVATSEYYKEVYNLLTNPNYYKSPYYKTYSDILDNIIFNNNFDLER